jgi:hypothetical protein
MHVTNTLHGETPERGEKKEGLVEEEEDLPAVLHAEPMIS